jgi:hypothetical protein
MQIQEQLIADIAKEVVARLRVQLQQPIPADNGHRDSVGGQDGAFATVDEAVNAAYEAHHAVTRSDNDKVFGVVTKNWNPAGLGWEQGTWQGSLDPSTGISVLGDEAYRAPPNHIDCGRWSARNCPFLSKPSMVRCED